MKKIDIPNNIFCEIQKESENLYKNKFKFGILEYLEMVDMLNCKIKNILKQYISNYNEYVYQNFIDYSKFYN